MRNRHLHLSLLATTALATTAPSQEGLQARLLAATELAGPVSQAALQELDIENIPATELLAALTDTSELVLRPRWNLLAPHVLRRQAELVELWHKQPEVRAHARRLYARLRVDWVRLHSSEGPANRAAIEALAGFLPFDVARLEQMRSQDQGIAQSAVILQRRATKAAILRASAALQARTRKQPGAIVAIAYPSDPFCAAVHMKCRNPVARAEAAMLTRQLLKLPVPIPVYTAAATHPNILIRAQCRHMEMIDSQLEDYMLLAERGETSHVVQLAHLGKLSQEARRSAALRLVAIGIALPEHPAIKLGTMPLLPHQALCDAIVLHPEAVRQLLHLANTSEESLVQERALTALLFRTPESDPIRKALESDLLPLLDAANPVVAYLAAKCLDATVDGKTTAAVRKGLAQRAAKIVAANPDPLQVHGRFMGCPVGEPPAGPADAASQVVVTAARLGIADLIDPLTDQLAQVGDPGDSARLRFLWQTLKLLAPHASEKQATRLFEVICARLAGAADAKGARDIGRDAVLGALYGVLPETMLDRLDELLVSPVPQPFPLHFTCPAAISAVEVSAGRVRRMLKRAAIDKVMDSSLYASCPDLLLAAWQSGKKKEVAAAVRHLGSLWGTHSDVAVPLMSEWPVSFVVQALEQANGWRVYPRAGVDGLPFELLQRIHREPMRPNTFAKMLGACVVLPAQVDDLLAFAKNLEPRTALVAARRLCGLGDRGREATRTLIDELLQHDDHVIANMALFTATSLSLRSCRWQQAVDRLAGEHAVTADIARMKLGDMEFLDSTASPTAVLISTRTEATKEILKKKKVDLVPLLRSHTHMPASTITAALSLIAERTVWTQQEDDAVVQATQNDHASVRRAAYAALATRDRELWPTAWLVYEAALDSDESVRALAPDAVAPASGASEHGK